MNFPLFSRNSPALSRDGGTRDHLGGFQGLLGTFVALQDFPWLAGNSRAFPGFLCPFQEFPLAPHKFPDPELVSEPLAAHLG